MILARAIRSNRIWGAYSGASVFLAGGAAGSGKSGCARWGLEVARAAGRLSAVWRWTAARSGRAGGSEGLPASILQNQSLSGIAGRIVARSSSHRLAGTAVLCGFGASSNLIASSFARVLIAPILSGCGFVAAVIDRPPSPLLSTALAPYSGRAGQTKIYRKADELAPSRFDCAGTIFTKGPEVSNLQKGSGVRGARSILSAPKCAKHRQRRRDGFRRYSFDFQRLCDWIGLLRLRFGDLSKLESVRA